METTKMTVEYLIIGILICLALIFIIFNALPTKIEDLWSKVEQYSASASAFIIAILLPVCYGVGVVVEYLGLLMYEGSLRKIKEKRFPLYIEQNREWLEKSPLLSKYAKMNQSISKGTGEKIYGEMRYFALMKNSFLYAEIGSHINQQRILRVLTIVEVLVIIGSVIGFIFNRNRIGLTSLIVFGLAILFLVINHFAVINRLKRYCRAIERSFKVLSLEENNLKTKK